MQGGPNEVENFQKWNQVQLNFFEDSKFSTAMDPKKLIIGQLFFVNIEWGVQFSAEFPLNFYVENCLVQNADKTKEYKIIKNGCTSDIVQTTMYRIGF